MQQTLDPKLVAKDQHADSHKTLERFYHVFVLGLMQTLGAKGWEVSADARTGDGSVDLCLLHKRKLKAVPIELKSSEKEGDIQRDANKALEQILHNNHRNPEGLPTNCTLREYGIATFHLSSYVKGRYLELNSLESDHLFLPTDLEYSRSVGIKR